MRRRFNPMTQQCRRYLRNQIIIIGSWQSTPFLTTLGQPLLNCKHSLKSHRTLEQQRGREESGPELLLLWSHIWTIGHSVKTKVVSLGSQIQTLYKDAPTNTAALCPLHVWMAESSVPESGIKIKLHIHAHTHTYIHAHMTRYSWTHSYTKTTITIQQNHLH